MSMTILSSVDLSVSFSSSNQVQFEPVRGNVFNVTSRRYDVKTLPSTNVTVRSVLNCAHLFDLKNLSIDAFVYFTAKKMCWTLDSGTYGLADGADPADGQNVKVGILQSVSNPHLPGGPVHPYQLDKSISNLRGLWCTFSF